MTYISRHVIFLPRFVYCIGLVVKISPCKISALEGPVLGAERAAFSEECVLFTALFFPRVRKGQW